MLNKFKLLFVIYNLGIGGAEKSLINLLKELDYNKFDVDLYMFETECKEKNKTLVNEIPLEVNIVYPDRDVKLLTSKNIINLIKYFSFKRIFYFVFSKIKKIKIKSSYKKKQILWETSYKKLVKPLKKEYDCAISYMHSYPNYFVIDKVNAKRKILWVHIDYSLLCKYKDYDEYYFNKADKVVTISEKCLEELQTFFPQLSHKFLCLYNLSPKKLIWSLSNEYLPKYFKQDSLNLLSVGRLVSDKGFDVAINAAKELKKENIEFKWVILGEGIERKKLENMIDENIRNHVFLPGTVNNPYPYFKNCDFVIQTSICEGKSIVLDEAKILKKPIICTNYNSVSDQIIDNYNGLIVPMNDYISLKNKILLLMRNDKLKEKIIRNLENENYVSIEDYEYLFLNGVLKNG